MATNVARDVSSPSIGVTKELLKTKRANLATKREYLRMMEERALQKKTNNYQEIKPARQPPATTASTSSVSQAASAKTINTGASMELNERPSSRPVPTAKVFVRRDTVPEVKAFPLADNDIDSVDGNATNRKVDKHLEASEVPRAEHRARMCMISAVIHMKCLASRKAKSIQTLRKVPMTTLEEEKLRNLKASGDADSDDDIQEVGDMSYLKTCRYLRGVKDDKELSVEEIFHL